MTQSARRSLASALLQEKIAIYRLLIKVNKLNISELKRQRLISKIATTDKQKNGPQLNVINELDGLIIEHLAANLQQLRKKEKNHY